MSPPLFHLLCLLGYHYAMVDYRIRKANPEDEPKASRVFDLVCSSLNRSGLDSWKRLYSEKTIKEDIDGGKLFLLLLGKSVIGSCSIDFNVEKSLFPVSQSFKKSGDLLEKIRYNGETVIVLERFHIHPEYQRKGLGKMFLTSLFAKFRETTMIASIEWDNENAIAFFRKRGFMDLGEYGDLEIDPDKPRHLLYKAFKPEGLCRQANW